MFICSLCSFSTTKRLLWNRHYQNTGHALETETSHGRDEQLFSDLVAGSGTVASNDSDTEIEFHEQPVDYDDEALNVAMLQDSNEELEVDAPGDFSENSPPAEDSWYPWLSRSHY